MKRRAHWSFYDVDFERRLVFITDDNGPVSVTNAAEQVVSEVIDRRHANFRVIYKDSDGNWDELLHDCGKFTGFASARHLAPGPVLPHCCDRIGNIHRYELELG